MQVYERPGAGPRHVGAAGRLRSSTFRLKRTTALSGLAGVLAFAIATSSALEPAFAAGGASGSGIAGGGDSVSGAGTAGSNSSGGGGGGGGGSGTIGGSGGQGTTMGGGVFPGGAGGATAGADGSAGASASGAGATSGGGGGGGGAHGYVGSLAPSSAVTGGNGGAGGPGDYYGGGGGGGGYGAVISGGGSGTFSANVSAGAGGAGGNAIANPGNGGSGGTGLYLASPSYTATILGAVRGGNGGAAGTGFFPAVDGAGGVGLTGASNLTVILGSTGSIAGGLSGDGVTRANAVTFTGGTNVFELQSGGTVLGNVVAFSAADTFRLGGATAGSFDVSTLGTTAPFVGFGKYGVAAGGNWTLTGTATSTNPWTIGGTARVDGDLSSASLTTVNAGGVLTGSGRVGETLINGGTLTAVNGTNSLAFNGNLTFTAASTYMVEVSPASSGRVTVNGTTTLGGATVNAVFAPGSYVTKQYTILNSTGAVSGTFSSLVNTNLPANFTSSLSYGANNVYLDLALNYTPTPSGPVFTPLNQNQLNVANALTGAFNAGRPIPVVLGSLTPTGLTQAAGETATGSQQTTFDAMNLFMGAMIDPFAAGRSGAGASGGSGLMSYAGQADPRGAYAMFAKAVPLKAAPPLPQWSVWATGFGGSQTTDGNASAGTNTSTSRIYGAAVGLDYRISPSTVAGFAMSGGGTNFSVANSGTGRSDMFQLGGFLRHSFGASYLAAAMSYAWQDVTTNRNAAGIDQLQARFNVNAFTGRLEAGTRYVTPWMGVGATPYAGVQVTVFDLPAYSEQVISGPGVFALNYAGKDVTSTRSELGVRTDKAYLLADSILTLRSRLAWAHEFNTDRSLAATFQSVPGASFIVNGAQQARDAALTSASAEIKWRSGFSVAAIFEGEFSDVTRSYAGKGVVRYQW
ncbi:autotransporter domain-containing protein [Rhodopseudomonas palustris]|uniref:autotransporter domain-containing protein n=1 Tax=Rhodopseudomonas palustris TaxID=1076 RepID=UPI0020CFD797|nr:autotransporter domain-containing protein [Rhodopseudomonas palustris]MCP9628668.1 autotransporter domain-containing protein [Rhodopseudomonas palustris]